MVCDVCQKHPARLFVTKIMNNDVSKVRLCEVCAREQHVETSLGKNPSFEQLVNELLPLAALAKLSESLRTEDGETMTCPSCGLRYEDFESKKRLGCEHCYSAFAERLGPIIEKVHKSRTHCGKVPASAREEVERTQRIESLKDSIRSAVREERYEEAAQLRDEIERLGAGERERATAQR
jgi:protein arginine kinase activator